MMAHAMIATVMKDYEMELQVEFKISPSIRKMRHNIDGTEEIVSDWVLITEVFKIQDISATVC